MVDIDEFGTARHGFGDSPLGLSLPFTERWAGVHDILARQTGQFVALIPAEEKEEFLQEIDAFLGALAQEHGYERRQIGDVGRWFPPEGKGNQWLSDVHLLATCIGGEKWDDLMALLERIRPSFVNGKGRMSKSRANSSFALVVVLKLLSERAARARDSDSVEKAENIVASLSGYLFVLACRGAHHFESSSKRPNPSKRAKGSDEELRRLATRLLATEIAPINLTSKILEQVGDKFGGEHHLRIRLQGLGQVPIRARTKKRT